jgi:putative endonuclease
MTSAPLSTRARGFAVEQSIAELLDRHGLVVVERNVSIAGAEIDLIATTHTRVVTPRVASAQLRLFERPRATLHVDDDTPRGLEPLVVFVEVRSRADDRLGHPLETIDARKRARIVRAATAWLVRESLWEKVAVRFDVIGVLTRDARAPDIAPSIIWLRGAFEAAR